eukprot:1083435-Pelagomonas_calceolata.AAC.5
MGGSGYGGWACKWRRDGFAKGVGFDLDVAPRICLIGCCTVACASPVVDQTCPCTCLERLIHVHIL